MNLVEQHIIKRTDPRLQGIDEAAFASKNLWNAATYLVRQSSIFEGTYRTTVAVFDQIKSHEAYQALPGKVSNQVLIQLHHAWVSFFEAMDAWREHAERLRGRPKLPGYQHKTSGRTLLVYEQGAIWKRELDQGVIALTELGALVCPAHSLESIVAKGDHSVIEVVYQDEPKPAAVDPALCVAAAQGVNVLALAALTSNKAGFVPRLVNGRPVKNIKQFYNTQRTHNAHTTRPPSKDTCQNQPLHLSPA